MKFKIPIGSRPRLREVPDNLLGSQLRFVRRFDEEMSRCSSKCLKEEGIRGLVGVIQEAKTEVSAKGAFANKQLMAESEEAMGRLMVYSVRKIIFPMALRLFLEHGSKGGQTLLDLVGSGAETVGKIAMRFDPKGKTSFHTQVFMCAHNAMLESLGQQQIKSPPILYVSLRYGDSPVSTIGGKDGETASVGKHARISQEGDSAPSLFVPIDSMPAQGLVSASTPDQDTLQNDRRIFIGNALGRLNERERFVVEQYYLENRTHDEIGIMMHLTGSRVQQICTKAIRRLRWIAQSTDLREALDIPSQALEAI